MAERDNVFSRQGDGAGQQPGPRRLAPATSGIIPTPRRHDIPGFEPKPAVAGPAGVAGSAGSAGLAPAQGQVEARQLVVGREVRIEGRIEACELLVVDGEVASETACRAIRVTESGVFRGTCEVAEADIRGRFEGTLVVREKLMLRAAGRIEGTVRYAAIEIEPGGVVAGQMDHLDKADAQSPTKTPAEPPAQASAQASAKASAKAMAKAPAKTLAKAPAKAKAKRAVEGD